MLLRRPRRFALAGIGAGIVVFIAISFFLARILGANGAEQSAITALVTAEARGDRGAMVAQLYRCSLRPSCRERVAEDAVALRRAGKVSIIQLAPSTSFSLGGTVGTARVAWIAGSSLPVVQCVRVRRAGNLIDGLRVQLLELSLRIKSDGRARRGTEGRREGGDAKRARRRHRGMRAGTSTREDEGGDLYAGG